MERFYFKAFHFGLGLALNTGLYLDLLFYFLAYSWGPKESEQILSVFPGVEEVWKNKVSACRLFGLVLKKRKEKEMKQGRIRPYIIG